LYFARFITAALWLCLWLLDSSALASAPTFEADIKPLVAKYCVKCHSGKKPKGKIDFTKIATAQDAAAQFEVWESAIELLGDDEMPPEDAKQPTKAERAKFKTWYQERLVRSVKAHPGYFKPRRLSATEYRNTLRSLFGFDLEVAVVEAEQTVIEKSLVMKLLPLDPPGKSGFRNDTSGNPLTTVTWDQYAYLTDAALERFFSPSSKKQLEAITGPVVDDSITKSQAKKILRSFLPRIYRRPVPESDLSQAITAVNSADDFVAALKIELKAAMMSPRFIYRGMLMRGKSDVQRPVDDYELAERLSYFVWADMPDAELTQLAAEGKLGDSATLESQIDRMLASAKARSLAEDFAAQWLSLDEVAKNMRNPPQRIAFQSQPIDFMHHLFTANRPLIGLINGRFAFVNRYTQGFYSGDRRQLKPHKKPKGIEVQTVPNQLITLNSTPERGGVLTIPGVLQMNRGPVLRGVWMLERILGDHLPDPPMNVGQVPKNKRGQNLTFRQRFELHRSKATCAICHDKIDPLGFGLAGYDGNGGFAKNRRGPNKIDTAGRLPSGETFENFQELRQILVTSQREKVIRNIVRQMLSYALCRKLKIYDRPTVDKIVEKVNNDKSTYRDLIIEIANCLPFRQTVLRGKKS